MSLNSYGSNSKTNFLPASISSTLIFSIFKSLVLISVCCSGALTYASSYNLNSAPQKVARLLNEQDFVINLTYCAVYS